MGSQCSDDTELRRLQETVESQRHVLQDQQALSASQTWLKPQLETPEGTQQVYFQLEKMVVGQAFLSKLTGAFTNSKQKQPPVPAADAKPDVTQAEFWEDCNDLPEAETEDGTVGEEYEKVAVEEQEPIAEPLDSYVMVEKDDVLEAIGTFVAAYLVELPEAQNLKPAELQQAVQRALKELQKSRLRRFWGWGRCIYRCVAFSYGAFSVYENPWLVRALLAALWTASKMMFGLLI